MRLLLLLLLGVTGCAAVPTTSLRLSEDPASATTWKKLLGAWVADVGPTHETVSLRFTDRPRRALYDLPGQEAIGVLVTGLDIDGTRVRFEVASLGIRFEGELLGEGQHLNGALHQHGASDSLAAHRVNADSIAHLVPRLDAHGRRQLIYSYVPPEDVGDGWKTGGIAAEAEPVLARLLERVLDGSLERVDSVLVAVNGKLVIEEYFHGFERTRKHRLRSVTKSVASMLVGVALEAGYFESVETTLAELLPGLAEQQGWSARKRSITLAHLLTMTSGLEGNDWRDDFAGTHAVVGSQDWVRHVLARPVVAEPGRRFAYSGSSLMALSGALEAASGMPVTELAERRLFRPLGLSDVRWATSPTGATYLGSGLRLRPRDLAKLGQVMLDGGRWKDRQIVPASWVHESTRGRQRAGSRGFDYGYLWWSTSIETSSGSTPAFLASGLGGQHVVVVPDRSVVIVITAGNYEARSRRLKDQSIRMLPELLDAVSAR